VVLEFRDHRHPDPCGCAGLLAPTETGRIACGEYSEEPGTLFYFKYRLQGSDDYIPVATTRPETILGDTAVAVHPEDERYQRFIGRTALVPVLTGFPVTTPAIARWRAPGDRFRPKHQDQHHGQQCPR
jgi:hypothetical protein